MKPQQVPLTYSLHTAFRETTSPLPGTLLVRNWFLSVWVEMTGAEQGRTETFVAHHIQEALH